MCAASPISASRSADERARGEQTERKGAARRRPLRFAEMQAETPFQLGVEFIVRQRDDALGLALFFRPHDRRALSLQRQDRERPRRQEMLLGAAVMIALVRDRGDDRRLVVVPAVRRNAGLLADPRARAVGADQKPRRNFIAIREPNIDPRSIMLDSNPTAVARRCTPSALALSTSASTKWRFSTICAKGSPGSISPPKLRKVGRTASSSLELVTTMSRIGCASSSTGSQTPMASNRRRAAAAMAEARGSFDRAAASAGSATVTAKPAPSAWRSATARRDRQSRHRRLPCRRVRSRDWIRA